MNLVVKEYELEQDETVKKGTKYIHYVDVLTGKKYRPKDGLVVVGSDDVFEEVEVVTPHNTLNHGARKNPEFDTVGTVNCAHTELDVPSYNITWTEMEQRTEMDKETFVMIVNAIEQNFGVMQDVKQLVQNVDGHTCGFDYLPDTMIKYLDEEMQTDLVSLYFFELELEIGTAEELYDFIIESRKCTCG